MTLATARSSGSASPALSVVPLSRKRVPPETIELARREAEKLLEQAANYQKRNPNDPRYAFQGIVAAPLSLFLIEHRVPLRLVPPIVKNMLSGFSPSCGLEDVRGFFRRHAFYEFAKRLPLSNLQKVIETMAEMTKEEIRFLERDVTASAPEKISFIHMCYQRLEELLEAKLDHPELVASRASVAGQLEEVRRNYRAFCGLYP